MTSDGRELAGLEAQSVCLLSMLDSLGASEWEQPTRCPPMTVRELVAHVGDSIAFAMKFVEGTPEGPATQDRLTHWHSFPPGTADTIVPAARRRAEGVESAELARVLRDELDRYSKANRTLPSDRLVGWTGFCLPLVDQTACRVIEVSVHTMDIAEATGREQSVHPLAAPVIREIFDGMLGGPPPEELGWDDVTYFLTASGRRDVQPDERTVLGSLADRFPLIS